MTDPDTSSTFARLSPYIIYRCIVGSRAYGLNTPDSDTDWRGIYVAPIELALSLDAPPEQIDRDSTQESYWELKKFLGMALRANPNALECLYAPDGEIRSPLAEELLSMRGVFLSKRIYVTYRGYAQSQFVLLERDLRTKGAIRWKHAMHMIRLLLAGAAALRCHGIMVNVGEHHDRLLQIRRGEMSWEEITAWRSALEEDFDRAFEQTPLPDHPDVDKANDFLIRARRTSVELV